MDELALDALRRAVRTMVPARAHIALGTGRTVTACLDVLADLSVLATPTSDEIAESADRSGIRLAPQAPRYDVYLDGVDQVNDAGDSVKGSWGAHVLEKELCRGSDLRILIATDAKLVQTLSAPVPIAVLPTFSNLYFEHDPRRDPNGLHIGSVGSGLITNPEDECRRLEALPGVFSCGIFPASLVDRCLIGRPDGNVTTIAQPARSRND